MATYPSLTPAQESSLRSVCEWYDVEFDPAHYKTWPLDSCVMAGYAEGWLGGEDHAEPFIVYPYEPSGPITSYVAVSPEGAVRFAWA